MVIDSFQKRFVMNAQIRKCFFQSQVLPTEKMPEKDRFCLPFFDLQKNPKVFKKARISKSGFKKAKLTTLNKCQLRFARLGNKLQITSSIFW